MSIEIYVFIGKSGADNFSDLTVQLSIFIEDIIPIFFGHRQRISVEDEFLMKLVSRNDKGSFLLTTVSSRAKIVLTRLGWRFKNY